MPPSGRRAGPDAADSLLPDPPAHPQPSARLRTEEGQRSGAEPLAGNGGRSPAVLLPLRFPRSGPRPPRQSGAPADAFRANERSPPACVGRRSMDGDARSMMSPAWTRSGSRPKIMVARFVTPDRDLPRRPFVSSEVRSDVRDRRLEWPPVRRVPTCSEPYDPPWIRGMGGWSRCASVIGRWRASNDRGPWYRSTDAPSRLACDGGASPASRTAIGWCEPSLESGRLHSPPDRTMVPSPPRWRRSPGGGSTSRQWPKSALGVPG
jgi:hypothetical protein